MSLERTASTQHHLALRAEFLARAGLERATAELRHAARTGALLPDGAWRFGSPRGTPLTSPACRHPSYSAGRIHPGRTPDERRAYSGVLGGSHAPGGDLYALKILDTASMIHVNDANPDRRRWIRNLCTALGIPEAEAVARLVASPPPGGFLSKRHLADRIGSALPGGGALWARLADHLTCYGAVHPETNRAPLNPNTAPEAVLIAVLAGVRGRPPDGHPVTLSYPETVRFVRRALLPARPFADRRQFASWLSATPSLRPPQRRLLLATFGLESGAFQLETASVPLAFRLRGYFEIRSAGFVYGPRDQLLAECVLTRLVRID